MDIRMPRSFAELNEKQLTYLLTLLAAGFNPNEVQAYCLFRFGNVRPSEITPLQAAALLPYIDWLTEPPQEPVRLSRIGRPAIETPYDPYCHTLTFADYLAVENFYQGYVHTRREELADEMAALLYGGGIEQMSAAERLGVIYWWVGLKAYLGRRFSHFFRPASADGEPTGDIRDRLQRETDSQIRALTGGDITKNETVLRADMYTALTELDAKAEEAEELQKIRQKA